MKTSTKDFPSFSSGTDPITGRVYTSQYDIFTVGAGYLDAWAALNNTDTLPAEFSALSPVAVYDQSSGEVHVINGDPAIWGARRSAVWGTSALWETTVVWGTTVFDARTAAVWGTRRSAVWGTAAVWGASGTEGFSAVWGESGSTGVVIEPSTTNALSAGMKVAMYGEE
jgi:hypothetical protein